MNTVLKMVAAAMTALALSAAPIAADAAHGGMGGGGGGGMGGGGGWHGGSSGGSTWHGGAWHGGAWHGGYWHGGYWHGGCCGYGYWPYWGAVGVGLAIGYGAYYGYPSYGYGYPYYGYGYGYPAAAYPPDAAADPGYAAGVNPPVVHPGPLVGAAGTPGVACARSDLLSAQGAIARRKTEPIVRTATAGRRRKPCDERRGRLPARDLRLHGRSRLHGRARPPAARWRPGAGRDLLRARGGLPRAGAHGAIEGAENRGHDDACRRSFREDFSSRLPPRRCRDRLRARHRGMDRTLRPRVRALDPSPTSTRSRRWCST